MKYKRLTITWIALLALLLSTGSLIGQVPNSLAEAQSQGDTSIAANVSSRISYQGLLQEDGTPVSGSRDMVFRLFSDDACTTRVGGDMVRNGVPVTDGLFSVQLDVDQDDFDGQGLWLEVEVGGAAMGCQEILPAPYALSLRPGATIAESSNRVELNRHYQPPSSIAKYHAALYAEAVPTFTLPNNFYYGIQALGRDIGVQGKSSSSSGKGVFGHATAASGTNYGVYGRSESPEGAGVSGRAPATGVKGYASDSNGATHGVHGVSESHDGTGVYGTAPTKGVEGHATYTDGASYGVYGESDSPYGTGVYGGAGKYGVQGRSDSPEGHGMYGYASASTGTTSGVYGRSDSSEGSGVYGRGLVTGVKGYAVRASGATHGVEGQTDSSSDWASGVYGYATANSGITYGVYGRSESSEGIGVIGKGDTGVKGETGVGTGVHGDADAGTGVVGTSFVGHGLFGASVFGYGVSGESPARGVWGKATSEVGYGVYAENTEAGGVGLYAVGGQGGYAAVFDGTAQTQVLQITGGSDLAEPFEIAGAGSLVPGLVVAIDPEHPGQLRVADRAYDRTVAGCISGANGLNPGLTLEQEGLTDGGLPVALSGRVYCWADASYGSIQPGDLLTSSGTPGHAMKVSAHERAQGAIIGKAMSSLKEGRGLILVLVTLQ